MAYEGKPTKSQGSKKLVSRLAQILDGFRKDPPTKKKLPARIDITDFLSQLGRHKYVT